MLARAALPTAAHGRHVIRHQEAIPLHAVGRYRAAATFAAQQSGPVVFAGDYLATATVDGALASGVAAADALQVPGD